MVGSQKSQPYWYFSVYKAIAVLNKKGVFSSLFAFISFCSLLFWNIMAGLSLVTHILAETFYPFPFSKWQCPFPLCLCVSAELEQMGSKSSTTDFSLLKVLCGGSGLTFRMWSYHRVPDFSEIIIISIPWDFWCH